MTDGVESYERDFQNMSRKSEIEDSHIHDVFRGVADPSRRRIMEELMNSDMSIAQITSIMPISRTAVNKHLKILLDSGLVSRFRSGRESRFTLQYHQLSRILEWISFFGEYWDDRLGELKKYIEKE